MSTLPDPVQRESTRRISGRAVFFILIGIGLTGIGWLLHRDGWEPTWQRWGMVSRSPFFSDLRGITGAVTSVEDGFDPARQNSGDPWHHLFNQPRIWLWGLGVLGLDEYQSENVGMVFEAGLLVALWWIAKGIRLDAALFFAAIFFSPATMLAVERCNSDLFMFFLLSLAYCLAPRSAVASLVVVLVAFMLKLYPLAGILLLLREPRERALRLGAVGIAVALVYLLSQWKDMQTIWSITEKAPNVSYGYNVLWQYFRMRGSSWTELVRRLSYATVLGGIAFAWWCHRRPAASPWVPTRALDGYRIGAGVYAGTFLLGNIWDYRLIFFFFALPQLFEWVHQKQRMEQFMAMSQLLAYLIATWAMFLTDRLPAHYLQVRTAEELSKWWLFLSCLYQLARTLPPWARAWLRFNLRPLVSQPAAAR